MHTIAVATQKGGAGKTTTAVNLAAGLGMEGYRVLLIDLDPQCNATVWCGCEEPSRSVLDIFTRQVKLDRAARETMMRGVELICSTPAMYAIERVMAGEVAIETRIQRALKSSSKRWDYVIIDCPPSLGLLTINALAAADSVIIPVEPSQLSTEGVQPILKSIDLVKQEDVNTELSVLGLLVCKAMMHTRHAKDVLGQLKDVFGGMVFSTIIRKNVRVEESFQLMCSIFEHDSESIGAEDYGALTREVVYRTSPEVHV